MAGSSAYKSGWDDGWREGYACKLKDATELFNPQSLDVPERVVAVAEFLSTRYAAKFTKDEAFGVAREMFRIAKEWKP